MTQSELSLNFWVEAMVAVVAALIFLLSALLRLRARHRDVEQWHIILGAAIYGAIFGAVIGFGIVPLRALLMNGSLPPQIAAVSGIGVIGIMIALRSGLLARVPFLGPQVKAFRRAILRRQIETAQKQLDQLTPKLT